MKTHRIRVSSKGQIVIPSELRKKYKMKAGTQIALSDTGTNMVLQPITSDFIRSLMGSLADGPSALESLKEERKKEKQREELRLRR